MINKVNKSIIIFCVFAFGFFISNLVRSITATLTPVLTYEFDLTAGNLGLLAGGYFIGFSIMQIPIGFLLDKYGPKKIIGYFLIVAFIGTLSFAFAKSFSGLLISRIFIGVGVSACMMGPLTGYRVWFAEKYQQRANSWMLMVANIGFVSSTLHFFTVIPTAAKELTKIHINPTPKYCDKLLSNHVVNFGFFLNYLYKINKISKVFVIISTLVFSLVVISSREHYTVDVIASIWVLIGFHFYDKLEKKVV